MSVNIKVNKLYGIRNKAEIEFEENLILFAPNGTGKSSLARGFKNLSEENIMPNIEDDTNINSLVVSRNGKKTSRAIVIDDNFLSNAFNDKESIIRGYLNITKQGSRNIFTNITGDYLDSYSDVISKVNGVGVKTNEFEVIFELNSLESVNRVNEDLRKIAKTDIVSDKELLDMIAEYKEMTDILTALNGKTIKDYSMIHKQFEKATGPAASDDLRKDFTILDEIKKQDRQEKFMYLYEEEFVLSATAYKSLKKIVDDAGLNKAEFEEYQAYIKANKILKKKVLKTSSTQIRALKEKITLLGREIYLQELKKEEDTFMGHIKDIETKVEKFIDEYNSFIRKINRDLLKSNNLRWSLELKEISTFDEPVKFKIYQDREERDSTEFIDFASSGQKRIVSLILSIAFSSNSDLVVFDDPITSMDSDNSEIFIKSLDNIKNNCVILTHSYTFASKFGFNKNFDFAIMDSSKVGEVSITRADSSSLILINQWLNEEVSPFNEPGKMILLSSVLREMIDSYLSGKSMTNESKTDLSTMKDAVDMFYRHYKSAEFTFDSALSELTKGIEESTIKTLSEKIGVFDQFFKYSNSSNITSYVLGYSLEQTEFKSFLDYVVHKYMIALSSRFLIEKYIVTDKKAEKKWDSGKYKGIAKLAGHDYPVLTKLNGMLNYLNHVNNLRWTPIVETPIHKLLMYRRNIIDNTKD